MYLVLGGNPAEAHPVSMDPVIEARERGTLKLIVVDPKFGRTAAKADVFAFTRPGTDVAILYYIAALRVLRAQAAHRRATELQRVHGEAEHRP